MTKIQETAQKLAVKFNTLNGDSQAVLDPATILTFAQIILDLFTKIKECKQNKSQATQTIKSPGLFHRLQLRMHLRNILGRDFKNSGENMVQSVLEVGKQLTPDDVSALYDEAD